MNKIELNSMSLDELKDFIVNIGEKSFRGQQIFTYFNRNKNIDIESLALLPKELRKKIIDISFINEVKIYKKFDSDIDNTKKYLFALSDDNIIESVFMQIGRASCRERV